MIGTIDIKLAAANPNMPLRAVRYFGSGSATVRLIDVPRSCGKQKITGISVNYSLPTNQAGASVAVLTGGCWQATIPSCAITGIGFYEVVATGKDENDVTASWVLGRGDLVVMAADGSVTVDGTTYYVHWHDTQPTTPKKGDMCVINNVLKIWNGTSWIGTAGGGGDISHSDFAHIDPETVTVYELATILKGVQI